MKKCSKCRELKDESEFNKHVRCKDGLESCCRFCKSVNRDKERAKELSAAWRAANPERAKANRDAWLSKHPEVLTRSQRNWRINHKERVQEYTRKYRASHRDAIKKRTNQYRNRNKDKVKHWRALRKYRERGAPGSHSHVEWLEKCSLSSWLCFYCGTLLDQKTVTRDHVVPISRGGSNDIDNIVPCCSSCNSKKKDKAIEEFCAKEAKAFWLPGCLTTMKG